jgi:hypothetical protein
VADLFSMYIMFTGRVMCKSVVTLHDRATEMEPYLLMTEIINLYIFMKWY